MSKWKPVNGETWRKRKRRYSVSGTVWWAPVGTPPESDEWEEIGKIDGWQVQTFGPGPLHDSVIISPPQKGRPTP
jgi:hypothetical protein